MGFERDYTALIERAAAIGEFKGYLDTEDEKRLASAQQEYAKERNRTAYDILKEKPDLELVFERIRDDLQEIATESPDWTEICNFVAEDLIDKLSEESSKSPLSRTVVRYGGAAILGALAIAYVGIWWYKDLTIDQPIETREGLVQRAAAYQKAREYDDIASTRTRRGGLIKGILIKPWEPDDEELSAATEFVGVSLDGLAYLRDEEIACGTEFLLSAQELGEPHFAFVDRVAEQVTSDSLTWQDSPIATLLTVVAIGHECAKESGNSTNRE